MDDVARLRLECDASAVAEARHFVEATLWALEVDAMADDAALVASELVTNAVIHARTEIEVSVTVSDDSVRISVDDQNSRLPTVSTTPEDATSGRGLHLVAAICQDWGVETTGDAKAVWAELARPSRDADLRQTDLGRNQPFSAVDRPMAIDLRSDPRSAPPGVSVAGPPPSAGLLGVGQPVQVKVSYTGTWSAGFIVAAQVPGGYEIRRLSDGRLLPPPTSTSDVRADRH